MQRQGALYLTLAAFWLALASPAFAQRNRAVPAADPSHVPLPGSIGDRGAFEDELVNRLNRARDLAASERLLKRMFEDPKALGLDRKVLEKVAGNIARDIAKDPKRFGLDDQKWQQLAKDFKQKKPLSQEQLKTLEKIAKGVNPKDPALQAALHRIEQQKGLAKQDRERVESARRVWGPFAPPPRPPSIKPGPGDTQPQSPMPKPGDKRSPQNQGGQHPEQRQPPGGTQPPPPPRPPIVPPPARADSRSWLSRQLSKLRSSTGLGGEFRGFFRGLFGKRTSLGRFGRGLSSETSRLRSKLLPGFGGVRMKGFMGGLSKVVPRNLKLSPPSPRGLAPHGLDGASASRLGTAVVGVLLLAGAGIVIWLALAGRRWVRGEAGKTWRLGPWPVTPATVQTRGDLVKAFEYLAMLLLGRRAVPANHLDIAGQLAADDLTGQRRLAAAELADLYEHARYAPPDEDLSPDEMASARRDLSLLAGRSAA